MPRLFEALAGMPVMYETLYVGQWTQRLMLADQYRDGRVFLAGDAAHLVIPTGGLGMNTGVGDAVDLAWKLAGTLQGWGGPWLLDSYEAERRAIGARNVSASRKAARGRRTWRAAWRPEITADSEAGARARSELAKIADREQRWSNDLPGIEDHVARGATAAHLARRRDRHRRSSWAVFHPAARARSQGASAGPF